MKILFAEHKGLKVIIAVLAFITFMPIALCQEVAAQAPSWLSLPEGMLPKVIVWVLGLQAICFGIGKGLTEIAAITENKYDNMVANAFTKVSWLLGTAISKFGWSMPKQVIVKEAEKITAAKTK